MYQPLNQQSIQGGYDGVNSSREQSLIEIMRKLNQKLDEALRRLGTHEQQNIIEIFSTHTPAPTSMQINFRSPVFDKWLNFQEWVFSLPYVHEGWWLLREFYESLDINDRCYINFIFKHNIFDLDPDEVLNHINYLSRTTDSSPQNFDNPPPCTNFIELQNSNSLISHKEITNCDLLLNEAIERLEKSNLELKQSMEGFNLANELNNESKDYSPITNLACVNDLENLPLHVSPPIFNVKSHTKYFPYCDFEENSECSDHDLEEFFSNINDILTDEKIDNIGDENLNFISVDSFNIGCNEKIANLDDNFVESHTSTPIESTLFSNHISPPNPDISYIIHSDKYWEEISRQAELYRLWLKNENLELDELENLIFGPKNFSSPSELNVELDQCSYETTNFHVQPSLCMIKVIYVIMCRLAMVGMHWILIIIIVSLVISL